MVTGVDMMKQTLRVVEQYQYFLNCLKYFHYKYLYTFLDDFLIICYEYYYNPD